MGETRNEDGESRCQLQTAERKRRKRPRTAPSLDQLTGTNPQTPPQQDDSPASRRLRNAKNVVQEVVSRPINSVADGGANWRDYRLLIITCSERMGARLGREAALSPNRISVRLF